MGHELYRIRMSGPPGTSGHSRRKGTCPRGKQINCNECGVLRLSVIEDTPFRAALPELKNEELHSYCTGRCPEDFEHSSPSGKDRTIHLLLDGEVVASTEIVPYWDYILNVEYMEWVLRLHYNRMN